MALTSRAHNGSLACTSNPESVSHAFQAYEATEHVKELGGIEKRSMVDVL